MTKAHTRVPCLLAAIVLMPSALSFAGGTGTLDRASGWYPAGSNITVTATAEKFSLFSGWSGDTNGCAVSGSQITIPVSRARQISAVFVLKKTPKGTSESWLASYSLTNEAAAAVELLDEDGDGATAWQEYIAGTDPTNRTDKLGVMISCPSGVPVVSFASKMATAEFYGTLTRHYALEYLVNLNSTNWVVEPVAGDVIGAGQTVVFTNTVTTNTLFYRARVWLQ